MSETDRKIESLCERESERVSSVRKSQREHNTTGHEHIITCVCERERDGEREGGRKGGREREREREGESVSERVTPRVNTT